MTTSDLEPQPDFTSARPLLVSLGLHAGVLLLLLAFHATLGSGAQRVSGSSAVAISILLEDAPMMARNGADLGRGGGASANAAGDASNTAHDDAGEGNGRGAQNGDFEAAIARALAGDGAAMHYYNALVRQALARAQRSPAHRGGGAVRIRFRVARDGRVDAAWVVRRSGAASLDNAAIEAVWRASPLPPVPPDLPAPLEIEAPILFEAQAPVANGAAL